MPIRAAVLTAAPPPLHACTMCAARGRCIARRADSPHLHRRPAQGENNPPHIRAHYLSDKRGPLSRQCSHLNIQDFIGPLKLCASADASIPASPRAWICSTTFAFMPFTLQCRCDMGSELRERGVLARRGALHAIPAATRGGSCVPDARGLWWQTAMSLGVRRFQRG